ncbi:MAG: malonyl-CoA/methylmalonyl-CoA synthetase [Granulosicoccus sp.]|jgi:malonyl-CoA/methylmalonyl-CoA synthetase
MSNCLFDALVRGRQAGNGELFLKTNSAGPATSLVDDQAFFSLTARIATVLRNTSVEPGDRVAVQIPKSIEALAVYVACIRIGAVFLPLNTAYTESELAYFINDATPRVMLIDPVNHEIGERLVSAQRLFTLDGAGGGSLMLAASACLEMQGAVDRQATDLAAILYTSGTTGRSKGAMLSHGNLLSNSLTLVDYWKFTASDVLLHALPIFHTHGLFVASNIMLLSGGRMIFQSGFSTDTLLEAMPQATALMGVPTFYTRLLADGRFTRKLAQPMRLFISGSAPLLAETHREFEERTGQKILERYGMTETNMNTSNPYSAERRAGTVGLALPGVEVRLLDPDTQVAVESGAVGMLQVRGPNVFKGYWQMPEKTREELLADGFFITGDLATIDSDGYITIVGRSKDLIISGGYNIYPKELELLVDDLPGVLESAVIGIPDADFGESVVAVVVRDGSEAGQSLTIEGLQQSVSQNLARFKQPRKVIFVKELPRNTMGKVQKNVLREHYS